MFRFFTGIMGVQADNLTHAKAVKRHTKTSKVARLKIHQGCKKQKIIKGETYEII